METSSKESARTADHKSLTERMLIAFVDFWKRSTDFKGRSNVSEYWLVVLMNMIISTAASMLCLIPILNILVSIAFALYSLLAILPGLSLAVRRLHDIGKSGWAYLLILRKV